MLANSVGDGHANAIGRGGASPPEKVLGKLT
jgi:hypothetical protein